MKPYFGFDNFYEDGTVTASNEADGFPKENAYDWKSYDFWRPTGSSPWTITVDMATDQTPDYWAIYGHNLANSAIAGSVKLQKSNDNFSADINDVGTAVTPTDSRPIFRRFATAAEQYWRLRFTGSSVPSIGVVAIGSSWQPQRGIVAGFSPPWDARNDEFLNNVSDGGQFLGRSLIRRGVRIRMTLDFLTTAWVRGDLRTFLDHAETKPFFMSWDPSAFPNDAIFAWLRQPPAPPTYKTSLAQLLRMQLDLQGNRL